MPKPYRPMLCLDFDGVIHGYSKGWQKGAIYDDPVPGTGAAILGYLAQYRVSIFSSRSKSLRFRRAMKLYVLKIVIEACFEHTDLADTAWAVIRGKPFDWRPWTAGDVHDQADEIFAAIEWPWFKPAAFLTIDDRALTFTGKWDDFQPYRLRMFQPWNARH